MTEQSIVEEAERTLRVLSAELTEVRPAECLLCYVHRMLDLGCSGLRWAQRYRDERAPRATALEQRLGQMGGFCDCEIFLNAYEPAPELWIRPEPVLEDGVLYDDDPHLSRSPARVSWCSARLDPSVPSVGASAALVTSELARSCAPLDLRTGAEPDP